jgi:hypothetical protein
MTTEKRRSPRKKVVSVEKTGTWGNVRYKHVLSCGHSDTRAREVKPGKDVACEWCLRAEEKDQEIKALTRPPIVLAFDSSLADEEVKIERARAAIASKFGVPQDAVDVKAEDVSGTLVVRSATVYLSAQDVAIATGSL